MAINKRRFLREATYARRCLRGRSCVRGRVVPCPAPQPGKVSGMGMQDRRPPRMRKKFPHQDSTLPPPLCPIRTPGPYPQQAPETTRETTEATAAGPVLSVLPPTRRPQRAPEAAKETAGATAAGPILSPCSLSGGRSSPPGATGETTGATAAGPVCLSYPLPGGRSGPRKLPRRPLRPPPPGRFCLHSPLPGGRSRPQKPPGRPQRPPPPGRLLSMPGGTMSYWNKWYQRTADERMGAVIAHNFLGGNLITLQYANPDRVTDLFVIRNWKAWLDRARISNGGNFKFIVGHDYGTPEAPAMAHYVFIDVAAAECERMESNWVCGPASVTHLDVHTLHDVLSALSNRPVMQRKTSRPLWGSSRKVPCEVPPSKTG